MNGFKCCSVNADRKKKAIKNSYGSKKYKALECTLQSVSNTSKKHGLWHQMDLALNFSLPLTTYMALSMLLTSLSLFHVLGEQRLPQRVTL